MLWQLIIRIRTAGPDPETHPNLVGCLSLTLSGRVYPAVIPSAAEQNSAIATSGSTWKHLAGGRRADDQKSIDATCEARVTITPAVSRRVVWTVDEWQCRSDSLCACVCACVSLSLSVFLYPGKDHVHTERQLMQTADSPMSSSCWIFLLHYLYLLSVQ